MYYQFIIHRRLQSTSASTPSTTLFRSQTVQHCLLPAGMTPPPKIIGAELKAVELQMARAHTSGLLPPALNDNVEYRQYLHLLSRGAFSPPHRTKTTEITDEFARQVKDKVIMFMQLFVICLIFFIFIRLRTNVNLPNQSVAPLMLVNSTLENLLWLSQVI
jgi:hypothetical protein